jgi:rfaE bifunctional protein nucleotidyltransferase chain/domain
MSKYIGDHSLLAEKIEQLKGEGKKIVFANGCFDILHVGHVRYLYGAKQCGDVLVVAVNSDKSVAKLQKHDRPIIPDRERAEILEALDMVDYVTLFDEPTVDSLLRKLKPHVQAKGTDYTKESVPEHETVSSYGGEIAIVGDPKDHSSRDIIEKISNAGRNKNA